MPTLLLSSALVYLILCARAFFSAPDTVAEVCGQVAIAPAGDEDVCSAGGGVWKGSDILSVYLQVVFFPGKYTGSSRTNIKAQFKPYIYKRKSV